MPRHWNVGDEPIPGYVLARRLGGGGFGEAWEATAPGGVRVALKFVPFRGDPTGPEWREIEAIRDIRHPHLLDVHFAVPVGDHLVIAMPLCDLSLKDRLEECRAEGREGLPLGELMGYMDELAEAVDYLNEPRHRVGDGRLVGVQHRDIKPHNVFLVGGSARLADFGLAKALESARAEHTGGMSPHYVAPEMVLGHVSPRTDQYSLAATYVHLRTGHHLFRGAVNPVLYAHVHEPPDLSGLADWERPAVARALAKDPEARWPNCRSFVRTLRDAYPTETRRPAAEMTTVAFGPKPDAPVDEPEPSEWASASTYPTVGQPPRDDKAGATTVQDASPTRMRIAVASALVLLAGVAAVALYSKGGPGKPGLATADPRKAAPPKAGPGHPEVQPGGGPAPTPPSPERPGKPPAPEPGPANPPTRPVAFAPPTGPELDGQARAILKRYCHECHGVKFEKPPLDVLDRDVLLAPPPTGGKRALAYVVAGKPDESLIWRRVGVDGGMPPDDPSPSDDEKATLRAWIDAGAGFAAPAEARPFVGEADVLAAILDDLRKAPEADREHRRYFTLANLHDDPRVSDDDLNLARAALAKLANSLSGKPKIVVPRAVDKHRVVYAVDLRDLGWDRDETWQRIVRNQSAPKGKKFEGARDEARRGYPYGLTHPSDADAEVQRLAADVYRLAGTQVPAIRADWFVTTASRPPLYEEILGLPDDARELERRLGVEVEADFLRDRLARAGFSRSGVSSHNRMVERHEAAAGAYWKSYDFKLDEGTASLPRFPLGPTFAANPFPGQAFEHAGGEIIFNLPNGLQAYLLVDGNDRRIEAGPIEVVGDALKTSGTAAIVNGLSCMACHKDGMITGFGDEVRLGHALAGDARAKVERLYPDRPEMDRLLADDSTRFLAALEKATGAILKVGPVRDKPIGDFPEPIGAVARLYHKDIGPAQVAAELGLKDPKALQDAIRANPELRRLGLGPLLQEGGMIKRAAWESLKFLNTPFQEAAAQLERGTPYHEL